MAFDVADLVANLGVLGVALGAAAEGEAATIAGGALARAGLFAPGAAGLAAFSGAVVADQLLFHLARRNRDARLIVKVRSRPLFARAVELVEQYPLRCCLLFRFVYGFRIVGPVAIGLSRIPTGRFVALELVAAAVWASVFTILGFWFGRVLQERLVALLTLQNITLALAIGAIVAAGIVYRKRRRRVTL